MRHCRIAGIVEHKFRTAEDYRDHLPCEACEPTRRDNMNAYDDAAEVEFLFGIRVGMIIGAAIIAWAAAIQDWDDEEHWLAEI